MFFQVTHPVVVLVVVVFCLILLLLRGRSNHPGLEALRGWSYAHRGLHGEGRAENSMSAFRAALEGGYGIELDIHLLKDGNLAVIHDSQLKRTTGADGRVEDLTIEDLKHYHLEGTEDTIPTFREVLDLYAGRRALLGITRVTPPPLTPSLTPRATSSPSLRPSSASGAVRLPSPATASS